MLSFPRQRISFLNLVLVVTGLLAVSGCGGAKGPKTAAASGIVTYKNLPVTDANVAFLGDGQIKPAVAVTDAKGEFVLTTTRLGDGAVPGTHKVTVTKKVADPSQGPAKPKGTSMDAAAKEYQVNQSKLPPQVLSIIPERYSNVETSRLVYDVKDGEPNHFKIELVD